LFAESGASNWSDGARLGATNPEKAALGTIHKEFALSIG
jgi:nucleoside diphosphate kinase